jgi:hypothetical protein
VSWRRGHPRGRVGGKYTRRVGVKSAETMRTGIFFIGPGGGCECGNQEIVTKSERSARYSTVVKGEMD